MRVVFLLTAIALVMGSGCKKVSSQEELQKIRELEAQIKTNRKEAVDKATRPDKNLVKQLGESYVKFSESYPEAPETPSFMFHAGELYSNELNDLPKAIGLFEKIYQSYPDHEMAPNALFFTGYLYHNNMHDLVKAESSYKEFLAKYPTHKMASQADFELKTLGMPIDEVFKRIMEKDSTLVGPKDSTVNP